MYTEIHLCGKENAPRAMYVAREHILLSKMYRMYSEKGLFQKFTQKCIRSFQSNFHTITHEEVRQAKL